VIIRLMYHLDPNLFNDIQNMDSRGSYGSKIQTLTRHLLYLQIAEPAAKSIVFSAWADSLHSERGHQISPE
jgi:E3 ubiquitin-protein ligase SHPRH